jgi:hypothetical protein
MLNVVKELGEGVQKGEWTWRAVEIDDGPRLEMLRSSFDEKATGWCWGIIFPVGRWLNYSRLKSYNEIEKLEQQDIPRIAEQNRFCTRKQFIFFIYKVPAQPVRKKKVNS